MISPHRSFAANGPAFGRRGWHKNAGPCDFVYHWRRPWSRVARKPRPHRPPQTPEVLRSARQSAGPTPDPRPRRTGLPVPIGGRASAGARHPVAAPVSGGFGGCARGKYCSRSTQSPIRTALDSAVAGLAQAQATATNAAVNAKRTGTCSPVVWCPAPMSTTTMPPSAPRRRRLSRPRPMSETARINLGYATVTAPIAGRSGPATCHGGCSGGSERGHPAHQHRPDRPAVREFRPPSG